MPFGFKTLAVVAVVLSLAALAPMSSMAAAATTCGGSTSSLKQLVTIENDGAGSFQCLGLLLDGDAVKAIRLETHSFMGDSRHQRTERIVVTEFSASDLASHRGAVLDGVPGHDAIILQGSLARPPAKSELVTSYLYNGFTGEYRSCRLILDRAPGSGWRLANRDSRTISHIVVRTRDIPLIGAFGIADLEGACS